MELEEIIQSFELYDGKYQQEAVDAACSQREEVTPLLLGILKQVRLDPQRYVDDQDLFGHIYALMLLGHFRETSAHEILIDLFNMPEELPEKLFGDFLVTSCPIVLLRTCGGNVERIMDLIRNEKAYDFSRTTALKALVYAMLEGYVVREDVIAFFRELLSRGPTEPGAYFFDELACSVCDLYPEELMDNINQAYEDGLINSHIVGQYEFLEALENGKENCLARVKEELAQDQLDNLHARMSCWACFDSDWDPYPIFPESKKTLDKPKADNKKKKAKKKKVKASRKINRKKKK